MKKNVVLVGDILMIAFLWLFPHFGILPIYAYPPVLLLILWLWLRFQTKRFVTIGFRWNQVPIRSLLIGIALALIYFFLYYFIIGPLLTNYLHIPRSDVSDFYFVRSSFSRYITILVIAWLLAVPFEEIVFRGFIFYKLLQWTRKKFWLAGFICSVLFGAYHLQQGWGGVIHAFIFGLVTTVLYKYYKGNLWYLIFFHSAYDTIAITAIRLGYF
jgi:membrane protease YdiL (CAAX protease family)